MQLSTQIPLPDFGCGLRKFIIPIDEHVLDIHTWVQCHQYEPIPEEILAGHTVFQQKDTKAYLSTNSIVNFIETASKNDISKRHYLEQRIQNVFGIKKQKTPTFFPIDLREVTRKLREKEMSTDIISIICRNITENTKLIEENLSWTARGAPFVKIQKKFPTVARTIRCTMDSRRKITMEIAVKALGSGSQKIAKEVLLIKENSIKIKARIRIKTKGPLQSRFNFKYIEAQTQHFEEEIALLTNIQNKQIPFTPKVRRILRFTRLGKTPQMLMEEYPKTLSTEIQKVFLLPDIKARQSEIKKLFPIFLSVLKAIKKLHEHGIAHLDIKPSNVLLSATGEPCLIDFSFASRPSSPVNHGIRGTCGKIPPEFFESTAPKEPTAMDIFSFGMCLTHLLVKQNYESGLQLVQKEFMQDHRTFLEEQRTKKIAEIKTAVESIHTQLKTPPPDEDPWALSIMELSTSTTTVDPMLRPSASDLYKKMKAISFS